MFSVKTKRIRTKRFVFYLVVFQTQRQNENKRIPIKSYGHNYVVDVIIFFFEPIRSITANVFEIM